MIAAVDAQTLVDAVGLGAVYALMAVGIGLVFGMLRLVNFAYGQLIMAGAYTLAFTSGWPVAGSVLACFAVVIALSFLMEGAVFRPLRTQSPAVMLVTTFAIAFLLQAVALILDIRDGTIGEPAVSVAALNQVVTVGGVDVRKVTILAVVVAIVSLALLALLLGRTTIGLQMRAAATDFRTARLLGVKADRVIGTAVLLSGILAAAVAVILTVQNPLVSPDFALKETIVVLVGVVVGGIDRLWTATLGGFAIGFATGVINGALPTDKTVFLPSAVFALVILVLLLRPGRALRRRPRHGGRSRMRRLDAWVALLGPALLVVLVGIGSTFVSRANEIHFLNALVAVAIVVAIYVFVGNSGVLSFGQISFVAVGAFAAGVMTVPLESKTGVLPELFPILRDHTIGNVASLVLAAAVGGAFAFLVGLPLMRLSGLAAGIATFAVLEITHNLLREWIKIGPGATTLSLVPETTGPLQATVGALIVIGVAWLYQRSPLGRKARATREDPAAAQAVGISVHRQRLWAFTLSGALCGFAGGLLVHMLGSITTEQVYLELTFLTLAMLVVGGVTSLWGAVDRRARGQRARLRARERRGRDRRRLPARPARGLAARHPWRPDGADADPAAVRDHRRPRAAAAEEEDGVRVCIVGCGAVGSLFAANLASLDDVEVWAYDLAREHVRRDQRARAAADRSGGGARDRDPARRPTRPSCPPASSGSSRRRRCTPRPRSRPPRTRSPTAPSPRCRTASATRRGSRRTSRA